MLTKRQFDVLDLIIENPAEYTQRTIAEKLNVSVGTINKTVLELREKGYLEDLSATQLALSVMDNYRVKRAVIIAAGFGSRLVPITLNTPKPLVRVNGKRIIDSALDALTKVGIEEIYVIRGYLGEQFDQLLYKYPTIKFIENPLYNEANNISSIVKAGDLVKGAYVLEADLLVYNPNIIRKYQYSSNYLGIYVEHSDDWCLQVKSGKVVKLGVGGENCYQLVGISYWTEKDGARLCEDVKKVYSMPGGKEKYWDQVPLEVFIKNYAVSVRPCEFKDIIEIDTFNELKAIDKSYC